MKRFLFLFIVVGLFFTEAYSQKRFIENYELGLFFGFRDLRIDSLPNSANLDFINYMSYLDYDPIGTIYIGLSAVFKLRNNFEVAFKVFTNDDIIPTAANLSAQHYFNDYLGLNFGLYTYPLFTSDYEVFHNMEDVGFHPSEYYSQRNIYDLGWIAGPVFRLNGKVFYANLKLNVGYSGFITFKEDLKQEKINSNFRRIVEYETTSKKEFFFFPEFKAGINIFTFKNSVLGMQFQSNMMISKRSLDYTRTTYNWSLVDKTTEEVSNPKHQFDIFDMDFGLFFRFLPKE
jgi:hypothetical protein